MRRDAVDAKRRMHDEQWKQFAWKPWGRYKYGRQGFGYRVTMRGWCLRAHPNSFRIRRIAVPISGFLRFGQRRFRDGVRNAFGCTGRSTQSRCGAGDTASGAIAAARAMKRALVRPRGRLSLMPWLYAAAAHASSMGCSGRVACATAACSSSSRDSAPTDGRNGA